MVGQSAGLGVGVVCGRYEEVDWGVVGVLLLRVGREGGGYLEGLCVALLNFKGKESEGKSLWVSLGGGIQCF